MKTAEPGKKFDSGKAPLHTGVINYFPKALVAVAQVSAYGAKKYNLSLIDQNWRKVPDGYARYSDALARHLVDSANHIKDLESDLLTDAHAAWNALARLELLIHNLEATQTKAEKEYPDAETPSTRTEPHIPTPWGGRVYTYKP